MIDCNLIVGQDRKRELLLHSPLLPAAGALGHAPLEGGMWRSDLLGAFVTPSLLGERGSTLDAPQVLNTVAGALLSPAGGPPLRAALRRHSQEWRRWSLPVIVALAPETANEASHMAEVLTGYDWVQGVELAPPRGVAPGELGACVRAVREISSVPCLVRVPFEHCQEMVLAAQHAGADGLVVAAPPIGRLLSAAGGWVRGELHSPALLSLYAEQVHEVAARAGVPIIARGEVANAQDALTLLAAGAAALQLGSILWVCPSIIEELYSALEAEMAARSLSRWDELVAALQHSDRESSGA